MRAWLIITLLLLPHAAWASLSQSDLAQVGFAPPPGAKLPLSLRFLDSSGTERTLADAMGGRPTLLMPVDYLCHTTCGPALAIASGALLGTRLHAGTDFSFILVGLRATQDARMTDALTDQIGDPALSQKTVRLIGDASAIGSLEVALGYRSVFDPENDEYAHPIGLVAVSRSGRVTRLLSSLALDSTDLDLAILEAGEGKIGSTFQRLALLCYHFDPARGIYTSRVWAWLQASCVITLLLIGGGLMIMTRLRPRKEITS